MIIPVKCFTCNNLLANKWNIYKSEKEILEKQKEESKLSEQEFINETIKLFEKLGLKRYCCRMCITSTLDMTEIII